MMTFDDVTYIPLVARTQDEARAQQEALLPLAGHTMFVVEDRWNLQREMMEARLDAHRHRFVQVYARNCEVRRIEKPVASAFLASCHSYGDASCRYRYGLFVRRTTGEKGKTLPAGTMVAVSEFSSARNWVKGERTVRSCEWIRYASLPGVRVAGGMGKMLAAFIDEVHPDDVMTYADLEWSDGSAYLDLGFELEGRKDPVMFYIDPADWKRHPLKADEKPPVETEGLRYYLNFGSLKYRLRLPISEGCRE